MTIGTSDYEDIVREVEDSKFLDLCLEVIPRSTDVNLNGIFFFTNDDSRHCFNVTIIDDDVFEGNEFFTVVARENPPFFTDINGVNIDPNRSNVTITIVNQYCTLTTQYVL